MKEDPDPYIMEMISLIFSISHFGVEVAPQMPTESFSLNQLFFISSADDMK
jgi:hypothetical protein